MWTPICHVGSRSLPSKNRRRSTCVAGRILINEIKLRCASSLGSDGPAAVECVARSGQTIDVVCLGLRTNGSTGATGAAGTEPTLNSVARLTATFYGLSLLAGVPVSAQHGTDF